MDDLWRFTAEMFATDAVDRAMFELGIAPDLAELKLPLCDIESNPGSPDKKTASTKPAA